MPDPSSPDPTPSDEVRSGVGGPVPTPEQAALAAVDLAGLVVAVVDPAGTVLHLAGLPDPTGAIGRPLAEVFPAPAGAPSLDALVRRAAAGEAVERVEVPCAPAGEPGRVLAWSAARITDPTGGAGTVVATALDVTERREVEEELTWRAFHDPLTGLANRALLRDRLVHATARLSRDDNVAAVIFLDIDDFKAVNDTHGHEVGDKLLVTLADRMRAAVRPGDTVARLGGDEFVVLCEDIDDPEVAQAVSRRVSQTVGEPYRVGDLEVAVHVSVGLAIAEPTRRDPEDVLRLADEEMYRAKRTPRRPAPASPPSGS